MDSAGCLLPSDVKEIFSSLKHIKINLGFHAHNNLGNAVWNTVEAYKNGANILDASIHGVGAGAGNAQLEILLTVLSKINKSLFRKFNIESIYNMSEGFEDLLKKQKINYIRPFSNSMNILSAKFGLFKVNKLNAFRAISEKKLVAGQEDLIMNIIFNLSKNK